MIKRLAVALMTVMLVVGAVVALPASQAEAKVVVFLYADASCESGVGATVTFINDNTGAIEATVVGCVI